MSDPLFQLDESEQVTLTLPQAASIFLIPYLDNEAGLSSADGKAALGWYHYYDAEDLPTFITLPQAASLFQVPYLDDASAISGGDGAQVMGGYRYDYSPPVVQPDDGASGAVGGRYRRGDKKRYYRELERLLRPIEPPKPQVDEGEAPERSWSYMGDNVVDIPSGVVVQELGVDWISMVPGAGISDALKQRIAAAYLMLE